MPDSRCPCRTSEFCSPGNSSFFAEVTLDRNPGVFPVLTCEEALDFSTRDGEGQRPWRAVRGTSRRAGNFFRFDKLRRGGLQEEVGVARCSRSRPGGLKLLGRERYVLLYHERKATNGQPPFRSPSSCPRGICPGTGLLPYCYSAFFVAPPLAVPANVFSSGKDSRASLRVEEHLLEDYVRSASGRGKKGPTPLEGLLQGVVEKPPK